MNKAMQNDFFDSALSVVSGALLTITAYLLKMDWHVLLNEGSKIFEAFIIGVCGGVGGYLGKKWITNLFKNKKVKDAK